MLIASWDGNLRADDVTARYFDGLRERRLFTLAEDYCRQRLSEELLPDDLRAQFTLELARTYTEHARFTAGEEQAALWSQADAVLEQYIAEHPRDPARIEIGSQNLADADFVPGHPNRELVARVRGPVLRQIAALFASDWFIETGERLQLDAFIDDAAGPTPAQLLPGGPAYPFENARNVVVALVQRA